MPPPSNFDRNASKSKRKSQTTLTFDPVGGEHRSSSPATKMSPARVRYQLPTPARSSQVLGSRSSGRGLRSVDNDNDLPASRDNLYSATSDEDEPIATPVKKKITKPLGAFSSLSERAQQKKKQVRLADTDSSEDDQDQDDEDDEDELSLLTPQPKERGSAEAGKNKGYDKGASTSSKKGPINLDEEDDEDEPVASSARRRSRPTLIPSDDEDAGFPMLPKLKVSAPNIERGGPHRGSDIIELSSDEDSDIDVPSSAKRRHSKTIIESESGQEAPVSSPLKRRKEASESDESDVIRSPLKRSRPTLVVPDKDEGEDEESDIPRGRPRDGKPRPEAGTSPVTPSRVTRQARAPRKQHRTAKQKAAELLKRKRAGEKIDKLTDSSSSSDGEGALYDSDSDHQVLEHFSDEESSPESVRGRELARRTPGQNEESGGEEDNDEDEEEEEDEDEENPKWLIDDGNDYRLEMPLQFSRQSHRPLKENFEDCVEWLVRKTLDPEFIGKDDERFRHAFAKVDDEARGYATSSFLSSQWTAEFTASIKARPVLTMRPVSDGEGFDVTGVPKCDACNHRKHPPKYALSFRGEPYVKKTLENVEQDSDYEDDDEDEIAIDEDGNELAPASREWFSGRDCSDKAFLAHKLIHWKYSLNEAVGDILQNGGHMTQRKIAKRDAASEEQRAAYADKVVQAWIVDKTVHSLYREFKEMMENARAYEPRRYR